MTLNHLALSGSYAVLKTQQLSLPVTLVLTCIWIQFTKEMFELNCVYVIKAKSRMDRQKDELWREMCLYVPTLIERHKKNNKPIKAFQRRNSKFQSETSCF